MFPNYQEEPRKFARVRVASSPILLTDISGPVWIVWNEYRIFLEKQFHPNIYSYSTFLLAFFRFFAPLTLSTHLWIKLAREFTSYIIQIYFFRHSIYIWNMKVVLVYSYKSYSFVTFIIRYAKCFINSWIMGVEEGIMFNKEVPSWKVSSSDYTLFENDSITGINYPEHLTPILHHLW